jgi:hypothetical protein
VTIGQHPRAGGGDVVGVVRLAQRPGQGGERGRAADADHRPPVARAGQPRAQAVQGGADGGGPGRAAGHQGDGAPAVHAHRGRPGVGGDVGQDGPGQAGVAGRVAGRVAVGGDGGDDRGEGRVRVQAGLPQPDRELAPVRCASGDERDGVVGDAAGQGVPVGEAARPLDGGHRDQLLDVLGGRVGGAGGRGGPVHGDAPRREPAVVGGGRSDRVHRGAAGAGGEPVGGEERGDDGVEVGREPDRRPPGRTR